MSKWISKISPRSEEGVANSKNQFDPEDSLLSDLVIDEIEAHVIDFEKKKEELKSQSDQSEVPIYSWLKSGNSENRSEKYLTMQERNKLDGACDKVLAAEWPMTIASFKAKVEKATTRDMIIDSFISAVYETIVARPGFNE